MDWKRGLFRLWIALSVIWMIAAILHLHHGGEAWWVMYVAAVAAPPILVFSLYFVAVWVIRGFRHDN